MRKYYERLLAQSYLSSVILAVCLTVTGIAAYKSFSDSLREYRIEFRAEAHDHTMSVLGHLKRYELALQGLNAHIAASREISREQFHRYVQGLDLPANYTGIANIGMARRVAHADKAAFEYSVRHDKSVRPEGYPEFAIKPAGSRDEYVVLDFLEPWEGNRQGHGIDIAGDPQRKAAMELARDTGKLTYTDIFPLAVTGEKELGFSIRMPLYEKGLPTQNMEQRRLAFAGVLVAAIRPSELLRNSRLKGQLRIGRLRIIDAGRADLNNEPQRRAKVFYDSTGALGNDKINVFTVDLGETWAKESYYREVGGRLWYFEYSDTPKTLPGHVTQSALYILLGGILISLLVYHLFGTLAQLHRQALQRASEVSQSLTSSRESLAQSRQFTSRLVEALPNPVVFKDAQGRYVEVNSAWERVFGVSRHRARGKLPTDLGIQTLERRSAGTQDVAGEITPFAPNEWESEARLPNGDQRTFTVIGASVGEAGTEDVYSVKILIDITDRRKNEIRQMVEHKVTTMLLNARGIEIAMAEVLRAIAESMGWAWAARWVRAAPDGIYRCVQSHTSDPLLNESDFAAHTRGASLDPTTGGIVAAALVQKSIVWRNSLLSDMVRGRDAHDAGLRKAAAVPIVVNDQIEEVLEFCASEGRVLDDWMLECLRGLSLQIAMFITRHRAESGLVHLAAHDSLTQLPNRAQFTRILEHAIAGARLNGNALSIMFVDLDRFKFINDTLGHAQGDKVLVDVSRRIVDTVRNTDTVARLGGDEFIVLLQGIGAGPDLEQVALKIIRSVSDPIVLGGREYRLTTSLGISVFPQHGENGDTLLKHSDVAMYKAKQEGRNNFRVYDASMDKHNPRQLALEAALRNALDAGELSLHYQPKIDVASGCIAGAEALLRWNNKELGPVSPVEFIPIAEDTGMIIEIGKWVLQNACEQVVDWRRYGIVVPTVAVNLSPVQLAQDIPGMIADILTRTGLSAHQLELEITESAVMRDPEKAIAMLNELKALGVTLTVDDFGTGYSSLGHLKRFSFDVVKIDRSFVMDLPGDGDSCQITRAVVAMARSLRLRTVAEGVETAQQLAFLASEGCDEAQGYLLSKPLTAEAFARLVRQWDPEQARQLADPRSVRSSATAA